MSNLSEIGSAANSAVVALTTALEELQNAKAEHARGLDTTARMLNRHGQSIKDLASDCVGLSDRLTALAARLTGLEARLSTLEKKPADAALVDAEVANEASPDGPYGLLERIEVIGSDAIRLSCEHCGACWSAGASVDATPWHTPRHRSVAMAVASAEAHVKVCPKIGRFR